ncbi:MAG: ABC transporter permease [Chloroflexi bacterium]|nr:ABC transporter permease [Chloroflexota bacterium]
MSIEDRATESRPLAAQLATTTAQSYRPRSLWWDAWNKLIANRLALASIFVLILVLLVAIFGPYMTPYNHLEQNLNAISQGPTLAHPLGTDELGRDMVSRILAGGRTAVIVAIVSTSFTGILGVLLGAMAAYMGGWVDDVIVRAIDITLSFPRLLLAIFLAASAKPLFTDFTNHLSAEYGWTFLRGSVYLDYLVVFAVLGVTGWPRLARLVRGQVLSLRETDYIRAAETVGASEWRIIVKHLVPNALGPVIVALSAGFGNAMLLESSLSYLGLGVQPPGASWGRMISENLILWRYKPHLVLMPGMALFFTVLAITFFGDGLNDALKPRTAHAQGRKV